MIALILPRKTFKMTVDVLNLESPFTDAVTVTEYDVDDSNE